MTSDINKAVKEFAPLFDEVTTSDLQGITDARAFKILKAHGRPSDVISVMQLSDEILDGIYEEVA